ncbi:TRAM domain-containing protein [Halorubrum sp. DTA46]|uniref:TRAM domain-containing protein n=1 Tax=Halorubrum sp. DTA46 TaxID=3402162 RepID=UPI003AAE5E6C
MVEITDSLTCLFTGEVEEHDGDYVVTVPASEIDHGSVRPNDTYRVALIRRDVDTSGTETAADGAEPTETSSAPTNRANSESHSSNRPTAASELASPPVSEGDVREVTIETLGDKGDGIAKIERGYVVIVPDAKPGEEPTVEITSVRENVSFANVIDE